MTPPQRQIFRQHALQQYIQNNSKDVLPKTISPFTFTLWWLLLLFTTLIGLLIWSIPIPYYASAPGILLNQPTRSVQALIFFPANALPQLHHNQPVQIRIGTNGPQTTGHIDQITPQPLTSAEIAKRYALNASQIQTLPATTAVGVVRLDQQELVQRYAGSSMNVQYQQSTKRVLSLLLHMDTAGGT